MSPSAWAGGADLPLTSWREGHLVYVSATPMPMTADQALKAAERLIKHAVAIQAQPEPLNGWAHGEAELGVLR